MWPVCGKSTLAAGLAADLGLPWLEGDDFHSAANRQKMAGGEPLTDSDRQTWLQSLREQLKRHPGGAVLSCSALKRVYREQLRQASPGLRFIYLEIDEQLAGLRFRSVRASISSPRP